MPHLALEIPETYESITRPVTTGLVRDLIDRFSLPNDTNVHYQGAIETLAQTGSTLAATNTRAIFPYTGKVQVELTESYIDTAVLNTAVYRYDNNYVFFDPALRVAMWPVYTKTEAVISFKYRATSRTTANQWRDALRRRMTQQQQALLHEIIYHYSTPPVFFEILKEIWRKREEIAGYGEDFQTWLRNKYDPRMTVISNLSGERGIVAIPEKQIQVPGWFSFNTEPDAIQKNQEGETWEVGFDYTIQYEKVTAMVIDYPISVHNQLLDTKYLCTESLYNPYNQPHKPSFSGSLNEFFSKINYDPEPVFAGVVLPSYDDWQPRACNYRTVPIISSLIGVDLADPQQIVNLLDLGDTSLTQSVANFIFRYRKEVLEYTKSVFHVTFYRDDLMLNFKSVTLDEDMNLRSNSVLNPRLVYHFRLSVVTDLNILSAEARDALRNDPLVCIQIFDLLDSLQSKKLPLVESLSIHLLSEIRNSRSGWEPTVAPRPGFALPGGDYSHRKEMPGNPARPYYPYTEGGSYPSDPAKVKPCPPATVFSNKLYSQVIDAFPELTWTVTSMSYRDTEHLFPYESVKTLIPATDTKLVAVGEYVEGSQELLLIYKSHYLKATVNHFLQGKISDLWILTETDYSGFYQSLGWTPVCSMAPLGEVFMPSGITKPTYHNAEAIRIVSPERPGIRGPMLSDNLVILGGKVITKGSLDLAISYLRTTMDFTQIGRGQGMKTVMQVGIIAHKNY